MRVPALELRLMPEIFAVCRLDSQAPLPPWAVGGGFWSLTRTGDELSVVCVEDAVPPGVTCEPGWRVLQVAGPLDFALVGILRSLLAPLADAGVSIFALSTYDTDYVLVRTDALNQAVTALGAAGHVIKGLPEMRGLS